MSTDVSRAHVVENREYPLGECMCMLFCRTKGFVVANLLRAYKCGSSYGVVNTISD